MHIFLIQLKPSSHLITDTSAKLNCSSLPSCRASYQMCQCGCNKYKRCGSERHLILRLHRRKYLIGSTIFLSDPFVEKYDQKSGYRKKQKNP